MGQYRGAGITADFNTAATNPVAPAIGGIAAPTDSSRVHPCLFPDVDDSSKP